MTDEIDLLFDKRTSGLPYKDNVPVLICLAGFPDTASAWDPLVSHKELQTTHHIITLGLPGLHTKALPDDHKWGYSEEEIVAELHKVILQVQAMHSQKKPTIHLCAHDWGAMYAYEYLQRYPTNIDKHVSMDIGLFEATEVPITNLLKMLGYFILFAVAFVLHRLVSDGAAAKLVDLYPWDAIGPLAKIEAIPFRKKPMEYPHTFYPYYQLLKKQIMGLNIKNGVAFSRIQSVPQLFLFGTKKNATYHSSVFLDNLDKTPGCSWKAIEGGHWFFAEKENSHQVAKLMANFFEEK